MHQKNYTVKYQMDYFKILNLNKEPFSSSPDPDFFYESQQHLECLKKIQQSIRIHRGGLNLIIGDVGTGKTTLGRQLIRIFSDDNAYETHLILDPSFDSPLECLRKIAELFKGLKLSKQDNEHQIKKQITEYLLHKCLDERKTTVLIIDEGQKIPGFCLKILYEFLNIETNKDRLLQVVLLAQKEFEKILQEHTDFAGRISLYFRLGPLNFRDTRLMIQFRLSQSAGDGNAPSLFSYLALWGIYRYSGGYPRQIIHLCYQSILAMIVANRIKVDWFLVRSCIRKQPYKTRSKRHWTKPVTAFLGLLVVAMVLILNMPEQSQIPVVEEIYPSEQSSILQKVPISQMGESPIMVPPKTLLLPENKEDTAAVITKKPQLMNLEILETHQNQKSKTEIDSNLVILSKSEESKSIPLPVAELETIRGGLHSSFFRIVFQFSEKFQYEEPVIHENEAAIRLHHIKTQLTSFRKYKSCDTWVALDEHEGDMNIRIGLPENMQKLTCFEMKDPCRLVVNILIE